MMVAMNLASLKKAITIGDLDFAYSKEGSELLALPGVFEHAVCHMMILKNFFESKEEEYMYMMLFCTFCGFLNMRPPHVSFSAAMTEGLSSIEVFKDLFDLPEGHRKIPTLLPRFANRQFRDFCESVISFRNFTEGFRIDPAEKEAKYLALFEVESKQEILDFLLNLTCSVNFNEALVADLDVDPGTLIFIANIEGLGNEKFSPKRFQSIFPYAQCTWMKDVSELKRISLSQLRDTVIMSTLMPPFNDILEALDGIDAI